MTSIEDYKSISIELFVRGPTDSEEALSELLVALESFSLFAPTHHGGDERKRVPYDRDAAIALLGGRRRTFFIWNKSTEKTNATGIPMTSINPSAMHIPLKPSILAKPDQCLEQYRGLVERLKPHYASIRPFPVWPRVEEKVPLSLREEYRSARPFSLGGVRRLGFPILRPQSYVDADLAASLASALPDLGARPATVGGYWLGEENRPLAPGLLQEIEEELRMKNVLERHGLAGRMEIDPADRFFFGPNWKAPTSWNAEDPLVERDLAGPNE